MSNGLSSKTITLDGAPFFRKMDGVSRYNVNLLAHLANKYPHITFCVIRFLDQKMSLSLVPDRPNIKIVTVPMLLKVYRLLFKIGLAFSLDTFLPNNRSLHIAGNFVAFPVVKKSPVALFIHDLAYIDVPDTLDQKNKIYLEKFVPYSIKKSEYLYATSDYTKQRLSVLYPKLTIRTVSNALDTTDIKRMDTEDHILAVGTIEPRKNLSTIVKAYLKLPDSIKDKHPLILAGRIEPGWTESLGVKDKNIKLTGYISDEELEYLYSTARLFVYPSIYEGFGIPLLEAMRHGLPTIASSIQVFRAIGSTTIIYVDPLDTESWTDAILRALKEPSVVNDAAIKRARLFSWENSIENFVIPD